MSFDALQWALSQPVAKRGEIRTALDQGEEPPGLSSDERHVLISLADHHNGQTGRCHPGMRLLADETGLAKSTIQNAVAALRDFGLIEMDPTAAPAVRTRGAEKPVNGYKLRTDRRYGSVPSSGTAEDRPAVQNQEPNQEVSAPPALGTEPGTAQGSESAAAGRGFPKPDQAHLMGGLPGLQTSVPDSTPVPSRVSAGASRVSAGQCEPPAANGGSPGRALAELGELDGYRYELRDNPAGGEGSIFIVRSRGSERECASQTLSQGTAPDQVTLEDIRWVIDGLAWTSYQRPLNVVQLRRTA